MSYGLRAVEEKLHVHDLHATILWLPGLDNMGLIFNCKGRPERPHAQRRRALQKNRGVMTSAFSAA